MNLVFTALPGIPLVKPGDSISKLISMALDRVHLELLNGDILVIAQKIVSKSEGRFANLNDIIPSQAAVELSKTTEKDPRLVEVILGESKSVLRSKVGTIIVEHENGFICANAGIDHSNVEGLLGIPGEWVLLLPKDADASARNIRHELETISGTRIGVMIIDTHGRAWRMGTVGVAIGLSGLPALVDLRGRQDLVGYTLRVTQVAAADELAASASLMMGQASEGTPVIHVRGFPYELVDGSLKELIRPVDLDMFR